jgi:hypothetical protein
MLCANLLYDMQTWRKIMKLDLSFIYEGMFKSFQTGHLEQELQMVQLSATRYNCIAIL